MASNVANSRRSEIRAYTNGVNTAAITATTETLSTNDCAKIRRLIHQHRRRPTGVAELTGWVMGLAATGHAISWEYERLAQLLHDVTDAELKAITI
jgi:hypothetical protein